MKVSVLSRLKKYTAMAVAGAAATTAMQCDFADADIVYSGAQNIVVPANFTGIYIDLDTNAFSTTGATGGGADDFNLWVTGGEWVDFTPSGASSIVIDGAGAGDNLAGGTFIDGALTYTTDNPSLTGGGIEPWDLNGSGFVGVTTDTGLFGWVELANVVAGQSATVLGWAHQNDGSGIAAGDTGGGAIPEPGSLALVGLGAVAFVARRRRS